MASQASSITHPPEEPSRGPLAWWHRTPLYLRIMGALVLGVITALALTHGGQALRKPDDAAVRLLREPADLILRLLRAVAPPLILVAVVHALANANFRGRVGLRLVGLLAANTLVAILIGLLVANVLKPGTWGALAAPSEVVRVAPLDPWEDLKAKIPTSLLKPLVDNEVISVILIALAFGIALRKVRLQEEAAGQTGHRTVMQIIDTAFAAFMVLLHWIIDIIPFAVYGVVASIVATRGFDPFKALGAFLVSVLLALFLQGVYYMTRVRLQSWVRPGRLLRGSSDALMTAFSTASSTATMPLTYSCLKDRVGLREESASLGALVGANFNNDGTALYEAMAALFIAQVIHRSLNLVQQSQLVFTSVLASVGAPGIPEAGLVTMTLVFSAARLPVEYIPLLLTVDWFLDRCRTTVNVMGDLTVSSLLDGKVRKDADAAASPPESGAGVPGVE